MSKQYSKNRAHLWTPKLDEDKRTKKAERIQKTQETIDQDKTSIDRE